MMKRLTKKQISWTEEGNIENLKAALAKDPELINARGTRGMTLVMFALCQNAVDSVSWLIKQGADINVTDSKGSSVLHYATAGWNERLDSLALLIKAGAELNAVDKYGNTPLMDSVENGNLAAFAMLLGAGSDKKLRNKRKQELKDLVEFQLEDCSYARVYEAHRNNLHSIKQTIMADNHLINFGCQQRQVVMSDWPQPEDLEDLIVLARYGNSHNLGEISEERPEIIFYEDEAKWTLLHHAAQMSQCDAVNLLAYLGTDLEVRDLDGCTPLHSAARGGVDSLGSIHSLVTYGSQIEALDNQGQTPLMTAAASGNLVGFCYFIGSGSDPGLKDKKGRNSRDLSDACQRKLRNSSNYEEENDQAVTIYDISTALLEFDS